MNIEDLRNWKYAVEKQLKEKTAQLKHIDALLEIENVNPPKIGKDHVNRPSSKRICKYKAIREARLYMLSSFTANDIKNILLRSDNASIRNLTTSHISAALFYDIKKGKVAITYRKIIGRVKTNSYINV